MGLPAIKHWLPKHEVVVQLKIARWKNEAIAEEVGLTKERVSQILSDPRARAIVRARNHQIREDMGKSIGGRLLKLADKSVKRIEETMDQSFDPSENSEMKRHQDNLGLKLLQGVGYLGGEEKKEGERKLDGEMGSLLLKALKKSNDLAEKREEEERSKELVQEAQVVG